MVEFIVIIVVLFVGVGVIGGLNWVIGGVFEWIFNVNYVCDVEFLGVGLYGWLVGNVVIIGFVCLILCNK